MFVKRMLYCTSNGQELLSALGVTLVCHASNVFLVLKVPLSIIDAFSKVGPGVISNSRTFGRSFGVSQMFFFFGYYKLCRFPQYNTTNNLYWEFYTRHWFAIPSKVGISELGIVVVE